MNEFLVGLQREQGLQYAILQARVAGGRPPSTSKEYAQVNQRLRTLIMRHHQNDIDTEDFSRGVSYIITEYLSLTC